MPEIKTDTVITPPTLPKAKILIAEDDPFLSRAMGSFLEDENLSIDIAKDGQETIDLIKKDDYRLILLDLNMPHKNGFDVLREVNPLKNIPPILVFSSLDQTDSKEQALALGAREYFVKHDVDIDELRTIVKTYLKGEGG